MTVFIVSQETDSFNKRFGWHSPISSKSTEFDSSSSVAAELLQGHNYFNRRSFQLNSGEISFTRHVRDDDSTRRNRKLREYSTEDVVRCLDSMSQIRNWRPMHIAFIGDSTIRQHFFSFLQASISLMSQKASHLFFFSFHSSAFPITTGRWCTVAPSRGYITSTRIAM